MEKRSLRLRAKEDLGKASTMWRLQFEAPDIEAEPGQFVNIAVEGQYLRRPISVSDYQDGILTLIVAPVGVGTLKMVESPVGREFDMLTGLGNKFSLTPPSKCVALLGGGVGYAPLAGLMRRLIEGGTDVRAFFGFNSEREVPFAHIKELRARYGEDALVVSTMTGETGETGNPIEVADRYFAQTGFRPGFFYTCGPLPMMKAVCSHYDFPGEVSMEARMGCGFGACVGCTVQTSEGPRRICKEGPVFDSRILF